MSSINFFETVHKILFKLSDEKSYYFNSLLLVGMGRYTILLKHRDEILKQPLRLQTHIMEGRVKILETYKNLKKL